MCLWYFDVHLVFGLYHDILCFVVWLMSFVSCRFAFVGSLASVSCAEEPLFAR